jgi:hypothetical protein
VIREGNTRKKGCKRGTGGVARGDREGTERMRRGCCTAAAYRTQHYPAASWLNQADEADDGAE